MCLLVCVRGLLIQPLLLQVDIAYVPFIERAEISFSSANYDIMAGRPKLAKWIEVILLLPLFFFFSCQYSNHVNIFYQFFWASLFDTHCSYFSLKELWRLFSLVILVPQFSNAQNTPKNLKNHCMIVDLWIGHEYCWCIHEHQAWDHWSSLYLGGYCGESLTIPQFHAHYQTSEPWVLELISTKSKLLGISSKWWRWKIISNFEIM